jgi:hypothetical protein
LARKITRGQTHYEWAALCLVLVQMSQTDRHLEPRSTVRSQTTSSIYCTRANVLIELCVCRATVPFIFTDTLGNNPCGFPVLLDITTNKEILTTFTRRSGVTSIHTTGALKVRLTNTVTGKTIDRNISGPILATVNSNGSTTQKGTGPALWVFDPGVAPELPRLVIIKGKTESVLGPGTAFRFISRQGTYEDICAALAP